MVKSLDIAVLFGGVSSEREVSLRSGNAAARALSRRGHRVNTVDITTDTGRELDSLRCDVAFIALHGRFGEDGGIQKLLEKRGIVYTGSGPGASRAAMDKIESKRLFASRGIETPPYRVITRQDPIDLLEQAARSLGYPVVVKPQAEGSSVGVTVHRDCGTLLEGAAEAFRCGPFALMEKFVAGREMTVGILDRDPLPIVEVRPPGEYFDFRAKYEDARTKYGVDPILESRDARAIQSAALAAHKALGCEGVSRVDLIFTPLHTAYVLEVNTIPGMTERSLLPKAAWAMGIEYADLCERIVGCALKKKTRGRWAAAL
ncbi:MAG: D-alanine--D-alanine ligase [Planctomycetes bacterium]|nr:D-alanine--D-alanine ligase [Planctomycetota bacterium]